MSECVVRMETPENCLKCPLRNQCEIFCDWSWYVVGISATRKPYPKPFDKGCRIVCQLPEGHGRLGDLDAAINGLNKMKSDFSGVGKSMIEATIRFLDEAVIPIVPAERSEK